jgi:hypothetical protein
MIHCNQKPCKIWRCCKKHDINQPRPIAVTSCVASAQQLFFGSLAFGIAEQLGFGLKANLRSKSCARRICHELGDPGFGSCVLKPGSRKKDSKLYRNYSAMRQHDVENQQHGISHFQQVLKFSENIKSSQLNLHAPCTSGSSVTDWGTFPSGSSVTDWPWHFSSAARTTGEVMLPGGNLARAVKFSVSLYNIG